MKEYPIIFSTDMVKAILEGRKTMTRRLDGLKEINQKPNKWRLPVKQADDEGRWWFSSDTQEETIVVKPRYQVGDRLWVRETLYRHIYLNEAGYLADETPVFINQTIGDVAKWQWQKDILPSIHMPRWASRITLEITEVRVERLQEIPLEDIYKEGCPIEKATIFVDPADGYELKARATEWFARLWESLNAKRKPTKYDREHGIVEPITPSYAWASNPWVWVISFKR